MSTSLKKFRDRFNIPVPDDKIEEVPFYRPPDDSVEMQYLQQQRAALGGSLPQRRRKSAALEVPPLSAFDAQLKSTDDREISTTMAFVRILSALVRDKTIGSRVVPIVPDESRTFGMEGMFRQLGIFSQVGQLYKPEDCRPVDVLPGRSEGTDSAGRDQRGRRDVAHGSPRRLRTARTTCR